MIRASALLCLGLLVTMLVVGPATGTPVEVYFASPCKGHNDCGCPDDPQNYVFNIPGYIEQCTHLG